ncbi:hypothetical protein AJ88_24865 [Mesorhizobium amorphae CCBAU 01583]|nr:hypothetical protein AJ88_24865 [Mesorhizobium amorphae CCBAU 01583]
MPEGDGPIGPAVVPGSYKVELQGRGKSQSVGFTVVKDSRISTTEKDFAEQFALLQKLFGMLSALNQTVNHIRLLKRQLADVQERLGDSDKSLGERAQALVGRLEVIEGALVDTKRETPTDVRNPAGLNDTLIDLVNVVSIADAAPTRQARQVSDEIMSMVDCEIKKLDGLVKEEVTAVNVALKSAGVELLGTGKA